jgi:hypothetical protein
VDASATCICTDLSPNAQACSAMLSSDIRN